MMQSKDPRWKRDERLPVWQQVEALTAWRGDEARSIAYRIEWEGQSLETAIRNEIVEAMQHSGIDRTSLDNIVLQEQWGRLFCPSITLNRLKTLDEQQSITAYLMQHVPDPPPPVVLSGTGRAVTESFSPPDQASRVVITHNGQSNLVITAQPEGGGYDELLVNRVGSYRGSTLLRGETDYCFRVNADGVWTITVEAVPISPTFLPILSGIGDMVSDRFLPSVGGPVPYRFIHKGRSNFIVALHTAEQATLLQNVIGAVQQLLPVYFPSTLCWWEVKCESSWRIEPA